MIKLHTLVPAWHSVDFVSILPYPPYLSYLLLIPFVAILAAKYILFHGSVALFQASIAENLSAFFIVSRLVSVVMGTLSVWLTYSIARRLFRSRIAALSSALLLATSVLHEALSMVGRNWMAVSFTLLLIFFALTHESWTFKKRYLIAFVATGLCMGISSLSVIFVAFIALYYLLAEHHQISYQKILKDLRTLAPSFVLFVVLAVIPSLLYHSGNAFLGTLTIFAQKSFIGFLQSPFSMLSLMIYSEPVLIALFALGLGFLLVKKTAIGVLFLSWFLIYVAAFYLLFRFEPRFFLPLVPFFALAAGYAVSIVWNKYTSIILCLLLLIPVGAAARVSILSAHGDTRESAREWVLSHLAAQDRVLVFSSAMHIPTQSAAVAELRSIDASAVRQVDSADEMIDNKEVPYVLNNLTSIDNAAFAQNLETYAKSHGYQYLLVEPRSLEGLPNMANGIRSLEADATEVQRFSGAGDEMSLSQSAFLDPPLRLFEVSSLGPDVILYRIHGT
jgi:hypothetical protein